MKRGRRAGQGNFVGGRPKSSPNKAGSFDAKLPAIRCDGELKDFYEQQAEAAGVKLSDCLRQTLGGVMKDKSVINKNGKPIVFEAAVEMMDDDIREALHSKLAPCTNQEFFTAYENAHEQKFCEEWILSGENPTY